MESSAAAWAITSFPKGAFTVSPSLLALSRSLRPWWHVGQEQGAIRADGCSGGGSATGGGSGDCGAGRPEGGISRSPDNVVEAVVPKRLNLIGQRPMVVLGFAQLVGEIQNALNMVIVDVADQQQPHRQAVVRGQMARLAEFFQARQQGLPGGAGRPAVDDDQARIVYRSIVQQQRRHGVGLDFWPCGVLFCADGAEGRRGCCSSSGTPMEKGNTPP